MKHINCHLCNKYLGEIRDAKLRKGTVHICHECSSALAISRKKPYSDIPDFLKGFLAA